MKRLLFMIILGAALLLCACGGPDPAEESGLPAQTLPVPEPADGTMAALGVTPDNYPRIDGSTSTLGMVRAIFENVYGESFDEDDYPQQASKTVPSYDMLIKGDVDLILVPYASPEVRQQAEDAGVELEYAKVAAEALIFITPAENSAEGITGDQARAIYLHNAVASWSELGGPDRALVPLCRNADSGSQSQLDNLVLRGESMDPGIRENYVELTMEGMLEQTAFYHNGGLNGSPSDCYALGYTLFTYLQNADRITGIGQSLKILDFEGVAATAETIADGTYPLADGYYAVVRADLPPDHPARAVIRWLLSPAGCAALTERGFLPASPQED